MLVTGDVLETGKFYRDLFLEEIHSRDAVHSKLADMDKKIDILVAGKYPSESPILKDLSGPKWDEWLRFCDRVCNFDYHQNNYILITDAMSRENVQHFSPLRSVPWKVVLDFDPRSEEKGMYHDFINKQGKTSLINMITPDEIRRQHTASLAKHLDTHKTQWVFVNGREKDIGSGHKTLEDWKTSSVKQITKFFICCSDPDKFDKHKPIICLVLPFRKETVPYLKITLERLMENFDEFSINFVGTQQDQCDILREFNIQITKLSPGLLSKGMSELFHESSVTGYRMPTCQAQMKVRLKQQEYLYLKEYMTLLYDGCEDLPSVTRDVEEENKLEKMLNEHRESFMSGNWISLVSLFTSHDARREIGKEVQNHVQRLLDQGPTHSMIVEIRHAPGTGGSTIARRVMWDLHKFYPCAFARLEDHNYDLDDEVPFINELADRISALQDICQTTALILLDGNHTRIEPLSNRLVRALNIKGQRAVLLRCQHGSKIRSETTQTEASEVYRSFFVNVKLEDSRQDLMDFEAKYKDYIDKFSSRKGLDLCRVFHFPLLAMLQHFRPKLKQIVYETFDSMTPLEQEIAVVVAFIQKYAAQATPAPLLYQAFKKYVRQSNTNKGITYKDINQLITEQLLNLMVLTNPSKRHRQGCQSRMDYFPESYTFQHPLVADLILEKVNLDQRRNIYAIARQFLELPIFDDERFYPLMNDLFIRNRSWEGKSRFARLFEDLMEESSDLAGEIFGEAAEKTGDAIVFASAARFFAKKRPPSFQKAKDMITRALDTRNARTRTRILRIVYDAKGLVLQLELQHLINANKIKSLSQLKDLANQALDAFKKARNFPPTFPNPLIGEVRVWLASIDWIAKSECEGDSNKTLQFITTKAPPFFRTCISDSFHLLDVVDKIVQSVPTLLDPERTQRQVNEVRLSLMKTFNKEKKVSFARKGKEDVIKACKALCSDENFPRSSQNELKRLQAQYILSCEDQPLEMKPDLLEYLVKLLEELVLTEKQGSMAYHLMRICVLITGPKHYTLEKGLSVTEKWISESNQDPLPYFYQMAICFLKILDGDILEYASRYHKALKKCRELSQNHCRNTMSTHFLSKTGEGMSRLMTKAALFLGETEYPINLERMKDFWTIRNRKKLLECSGRIRLRSQSGRRSKKKTYIELVQGNIELYVGKSADIGQVERDFNPGSMVYFVVSFNLQGPVANGITFKPTSSQAV